MDTRRATTLVFALACTVAAIMLWVGGTSTDGIDCGSAISPASFDGPTIYDQACADEIKTRRINAGLVSAIAAGALWVGLADPYGRREDSDAPAST